MKFLQIIFTILLLHYVDSTNNNNNNKNDEFLIFKENEKPSDGTDATESTLNLNDFENSSETSNLFPFRDEKKRSVKMLDYMLNAHCARAVLPNRSTKTCSDFYNCEIKCLDGYVFPNGRRSIFITCYGSNVSFLNGDRIAKLPQCQPPCHPPCLNNGICNEQGKCKCPPEFQGSYCEKFVKFCSQKPPVPKNSKVTCTSSKCDVVCLTGTKFPDGTHKTSLECVDGKWQHTKTGSTKIPNCEPTCYPPCLNNGKCIGVNSCQCLKEFRGPHCEYNLNNCNITKTDFIGEYKCAYDANNATCFLSCPEASKFDTLPAKQYVCKYSEGVFRPQPLPKCLHQSKWVESSRKTHIITSNELYTSSEEYNEIPGTYSLYSSLDIDVISNQRPKSAVCTTWSGIKVKTFDGLIYRTHLTSWHTLVQDRIDGTFDIVFKSCPYEFEACSNALKIYWQEILYTFENINGTIKLYTPHKVLPIPVQVMGMKILPIAQKLQIDLESISISILWDTKNNLFIETGVGNWNRTGGLCGLLDGNVLNDFTSKDNSISRTIQSFTDSWKVTIYDNEIGKMDNHQLSNKIINCNSDAKDKARDICCRLLINDKLKECVKLFNLTVLMETCIDDYCLCYNTANPESCNCDGIAMLAKECRLKGIKLEHGWRNLEICPMKCYNGRIYRPCGPSMEPSCGTNMLQTNDACTEGCFCPESTVQYNENCISSELCPCTLHNREYKSGSEIKNDCNKCTCINGNWNCTNHKCCAKCNIIGDPHYTTFDGKKYDFMGKCTYYLLKTDNFTIEGENVKCFSEQTSCLKSLTIKFLKNDNTLANIKLDKKFVAYVNDKLIKKYPAQVGDIVIRMASSSFINVVFPDKVNVFYNGKNHVYIEIPSNYYDRTQGLCGTYNSNTEDDFLTPEGDVETTAEAFGDKWRTKDTCDTISNTVPVPSPCQENPEIKKIAEKYCSVISSGSVFENCRLIVNPDAYYQDCLYDICASSQELQIENFCTIISSYGAECSRKGVQTDWRYDIKECAIQCPAGQIYDECGDSCLRSCHDVQRKDTCLGKCIDGCRCPHGEYLNDNNECIPQEQCPCHHGGITFHPGYKEVRPGRKFLELCSCKGGGWECIPATDDDEIKYPPAMEIKLKCANKPFAEFSKCVPAEPKTCKNMHNYVENLDDCIPGCVCQSGYVFDTTQQICVNPINCSCHHGGQNYKDNDEFKENCNTCKCISGIWECTTNECDSTCSVWGDSHFTTFDNYDFDFQGACDYVLAKGVADNGDGFSISIQNVLCGTLGVTCSKSVQILLTGNLSDTITLTSDSSYFNDNSKTSIEKIREISGSKSINYHIYKAGVFIVIEIIPLNLQIKWDEGTRVYIKLNKQWKGKVKGLCGNYNDNANDDMVTPSFGLETSPYLFGHSWKLHDYCNAPTQQIDACKEHPERDTWAQLKCGILKSKLFENCHAQVPVEKYLKRCIFDTCACDQGGDCECLCTAIASYAYECAVKGIYIKWRTPHFCPMQCDPHCSEYKACTTACPIETCDNFLDQGQINRMCYKENCFEGCHIKECDDGMIYLNDTYTECVPKSTCKPICMEKDDQIYYEGDIIKSDKCQTCRCTMKKEICSGIPCVESVTTKSHYELVPTTTEAATTTTASKTTASTTTAATTTIITELPMNNEIEVRCEQGWTKWINNDQQIDNELRTSDIEKIPNFDSLETEYASCDLEFVKKIECRVANSHETIDHFNENVDCDLSNGLKCLGKQCHDYEIRVFCKCNANIVEEPTSSNLVNSNCDATLTQYLEYPNDCYKFLQCQPQTDGGWRYIEKTCGPSMMFNPTFNGCDHIANVQLIKPNCGTIRTTESTTIITTKDLICPIGKKWSTCANRCEHNCHHYENILHKSGICEIGEKCKGGCIDESNVDCAAQNKLWRDKDTCVEIDECPCMSSDEQYIKPHSVHEEKLFDNYKTCQCIDNTYVCNDCFDETISTTPITIFDVTTPLYSSTQSTEETTLIIPTTVTPPLKCSPEKLRPLIKYKNIELPDSVFSASSVLGSSFLAHYARLHGKPSNNSNGCWSPIINDQMQYLQVEFKQRIPIFGIVMQGSPIFDQYVTLFKILYSQDGIGYHYLVDNTDGPQLFKGSIDSRTPVESLFKIPIEAKSVRIYPLKWHGSISMRVELLGCNDNYTESSTTSIEMQTTTPKYTTVEYDIEPICTDQMGIENNQFKLKQLKTSSMWPMDKNPSVLELLKISSPICWKPALNSPNEFVQFDFLESRNLTGIETKGGSFGWVTGYKIMYSKNNIVWNNILSNDVEPKMFIGNHDSATAQRNYFQYPIETRYLKIIPIKWESNINMCIEPIGCFKTYPEVKENVVIVEEKPSTCPICKGIESNEIHLDTKCSCNSPLYWDGTNCVERNKCPCIENHISYPIGSKFENKDCNECVCVLGGIAQCKMKKCPTCPIGLRSVRNNACFCNCEPCPENQVLCPSSGDCIPQNLWCNGIKNCEDDEPEDCTKILNPENEAIHNQNTSTIRTCPQPECPIGMQMKIVEKAVKRQMSKIFQTSIMTTTYDDKMTKRTKIVKKIVKTKSYLSMAKLENNFNEVEQCDEFVCIPEPLNKSITYETFSCNLPKCPDDYEVEVDNSINKPGECIKYKCILRPQKDNICEISGKSYTTFDGTEFKYDICSHILARDLVNSSWSISLQLNCLKDEKICRKQLTIKDNEINDILTILPDLKLIYNDFNYTVRQLQNSPKAKFAYIISQPGNTILIVSKLHGFWVSYDNNGLIRVSVSGKFIKTVDGLCGYFNGNPHDDKRKPDGTLTTITNEFGDSWYDQQIPKEQCQPQICPRALQMNALHLCNTIKHQSFMSCGKAVNYKQFVSKCIETTCDCLKQNGNNLKLCKCNILQGFVRQCLAVKPHIQLDTWRAIHQCEIECSTPLVHADCYKRRCEPSCDTMANDDCPILPDECFSGCYCPEGTVRKGDTCIPVTECKNCICDSFGMSKYFTYDRKNFTFNGNCTYLLSRDMSMPGVHTFQVYVTMDGCKKLGKLDGGEQSSCTKALHVLHGDHIIHMQRLGNKSIQILVDGIEMKKLPFKNDWIQLDESNGKDLNILLPESSVEIKGSLKDMEFSIGVPNIKYGGKMEGLCGDCDGNPENDLKMNPRNLLSKKFKSSNIRDIVDSWQADEPKLGLTKDECVSEEVLIESCLPLPPEIDPCMKFYDEKRFGQCAMIVNPLMYVELCQQDMCKPGSNQKGACESLAAYARECSRNGICLNWRDEELCPYECPPHLYYESCGCTKTCDTYKATDIFDAINIKTNSIVKTINTDAMCEQELSEGCFCPPGKVLHNDKCIIEQHCIKCDDGEHHPGDNWFKDKCTKCVCNQNGKIECMVNVCAVEESICNEGLIPTKIVTEDCCPKYICVPEPKKPTPITCPDAPLPECGPGQFKKQKISNGCPQFICECKPLSECEPLQKEVNDLKDGEVMITDYSGCCPKLKKICNPSLCPSIPNECENRLFEMTKIKLPDDCCETYKCAPPKDACIVQLNGIDTLKKINDKWIETQNPCIKNKCNYGPDDTTIITEERENCVTDCPNGFEYKILDTTKCCGKCIQAMCIFEEKLYKPNDEWSSFNNCTHYSCIQRNQQFIVSSYDETCPDISLCPFELQYKDGCCTRCKLIPSKLSTCVPESLAESETVKLVQVLIPGHGLCSNKQSIRGFTECHGNCETGSKYNPLSYGQNKICKCCTIERYTPLSIPITCSDGHKAVKEIQVPSSCACKTTTCDHSSEHSYEPLIDIRNNFLT